LGAYAGYADHKGLRTVIEPAVDLARAQGVAIGSRVHDRVERWLPRPAVVELLQSLDIYACASLHEGTAVPVLEAMACGIPVVSTRVGILPEIAGPLQATLLVDRTPRAFADAFARLAADPELRVEVGAENRRQVEQQTWEQCGEHWAKFFVDVLAEARSGKGAMSESAVWERAKAWSARVDRVIAAKGAA
jgi:glycosyltransferase involved in cell wall biosynthesis